MSGGGAKRGNGGAAAGPPVAIPAGSRKMVQSLKEIVNCSEAEIYAMLKECNMDPSEAVHRLLTQDTFHEVKSKREKKKEIKDPPESRSRSVSNSQSRGAKSGTDRGARTSFNQSTSNDYGAPPAQPLHMKENGTNTVPNSFIGSAGTAGSNLNRMSTTFSEAVSVQNTAQATGIADGTPLPLQTASGFQHNSWSMMPGQRSMADIVRMGRPQGKPYSTTAVASDAFQTSHDPIMSNMSHQSTCPPKTITPSESAQAFPTSQGPISQDEEISCELGTGAGHYNSHDDWSLVGETSAGSGSTHAEISGASIYTDQSASPSLLADEANLERDPRLVESCVQEEDVNGDSLPTDSRSASISDGQIEADNSADSTQPDDGLLNGMVHHSQMHAFEHHEVEDVNEEISSATANMQQLNLQKVEFGVPSVDGNPAVIIPSHLQVSSADFSHLSFGSFGSGVNATPSGSFPSNPLGTNLEMAAIAEDTQLDQLNSRNPEYYDGEQLESNLNENVTSITSTSTRSYDMPPASQPENVRHDTLDAAHGIQKNFPSVPSYEFSATTQPTATYTYPDPNPQLQNLSPFSSLMQPYTNSIPSSLPSSLLAASVQPLQPLREFDLPLSALLTSQSMATKYNTSTPSISGPISMPEVKPEVFSASQPMPQALSSSNMHNTGGPALPQHLPIHPYSQPTLPLGHFANMIGYPFLPQSYTFLPSAAFQQAYASNSPFHQSPAAAMKYSPLPQYKSSISGSNLPQAPALPPGYGGFTSSTNNIPGSFSLNPSTASASTTMGFEEVLSSQYKEGSHYMHHLQHNENPAMWVHGAGSRTVSALPGNTFYGFQGQQTQQNGGFRQVQQQQQQQPSQYGQMGYLNLYQSQGGPAHEQHQQNPNAANLSGGSQGPASHQMWQHGY